MPSPSAFRKGFDLRRGTMLGNFSIKKATVGHNVDQPNEEYSFPTSISLTPTNQASRRAAAPRLAKDALEAFKNATKDKRILYSEYGSPYECSIGACKLSKAEDAQDDDTGVFITCMGKAIRRRDIPTLAQQQQSDKQKAGATTADAKSLKEHLQQAGYRMTKCHFATGSSKCLICGQRFDLGDAMAKPVHGGPARGGWSHAQCVLNKIKAGSSNQNNKSAADIVKQAADERGASEDTPGEGEPAQAAADRAKPTRGRPTTRSESQDRGEGAAVAAEQQEHGSLQSGRRAAAKKAPQGAGRKRSRSTGTAAA